MKELALCVLLFGQSNMVGQSTPPPGWMLSAADDVRFVRLLDDRDRPGQTILHPEEATRWGPEAALIHYIRKYTSRPVLVVQHARGGTSIEKWLPGEALYERLVATVTIAQPRSNCEWHYVMFQGERDARDGVGGEWDDYAADVFAGLRSDIGPGKAIVARVWIQSKAQSSYPMLTAVRDAQKRLGEGLVETKAMKRANDGVHLTEAGQRSFGRMVGEIVLR